MNSKKNSLPLRASFRGQAGSARQFKPVVAQLKTGISAQTIKHPVAPPVYRPQQVPRVLQTKRVAQCKVATGIPFRGHVIQRQLSLEDVNKVADLMFSKNQGLVGGMVFAIMGAGANKLPGYEQSDNKRIEEAYKKRQAGAAQLEKEKKEAAAVAAEAAKKAKEKADAEEANLASNFHIGKKFLSIDLIERFRESKNYRVRFINENLSNGTWGVCFEITRTGQGGAMYTSYHVHADGAHFKAEKKAGKEHALKEKDAVSVPFTNKLKDLVKNKSDWVDYN